MLAFSCEVIDCLPTCSGFLSRRDPPEIFETDGERRHSLAEASAEYDRLLKTYRELDYETVILPKVSVEERADFVLRTLR